MSDGDAPPSIEEITESEIRELFDAENYVAEEDIVTTVLLALRLGRPLLIEGEPGSGKTELGHVLANGLDTELLRLQCYEGLTAENALYEWNYTKQLLTVQAGERGVADGDDETIFSEDFLLRRPLLKALEADERPSVLLIDEVDRADEEFEALLLEMLSDYQISVPEFGTVSAEVPPIVVITSNRTRGLSDALKRRCLYLHISPPDFDKEYEIVRRKVPELDEGTAAGVCRTVQRLREEPLMKQPGVSETLDWAEAVAVLMEADSEIRRELADDERGTERLASTLGSLLKDAADFEQVDDSLLEELLAAIQDSASDDD